jgi:phasin family protein
MAQSSNKFAESFKAFSDFKAPNYDFNALVSIGRRNIEAFTAANQAVAEGAQAIARRQAEIARSNAEEAIQLFREVYSSQTPEASASKQAEFARSAFESALSNVRELFEMASKSNIEAAEVLTKRLTEVMGEVGKAASKHSKKSSS